MLPFPQQIYKAQIIGPVIGNQHLVKKEGLIVKISSKV